MKTASKVFAFFLSAALLVACASAESEVLKQARTIQDGIMKQKDNLDSTLNATITELNGKITTMSNDSLAMQDSTNITLFGEMQMKVSRLTELKSKLNDWASGTKLLPSVEDLAKGVENPFGENANDQDILKGIQESQSSFSDLKSQIESEMQ
jgi:TolA-binding protein